MTWTGSGLQRRRRDVGPADPEQRTGSDAVFLPIIASLDGPVELIEVGAPAGLCLFGDRYRIRYGKEPVDWASLETSSVARRRSSSEYFRGRPMTHSLLLRARELRNKHLIEPGRLTGDWTTRSPTKSANYRSGRPSKREDPDRRMGRSDTSH